MKVGDVVMFIDEGRYAKWFYGQLAIVESANCTIDDKLYCRVRWVQPVKYFESNAFVSDFAADKFEVFGEGQSLPIPNKASNQAGQEAIPNPEIPL